MVVQWQNRRFLAGDERTPEGLSIALDKIPEHTRALLSENESPSCHGVPRHSFRF